MLSKTEKQKLINMNPNSNVSIFNINGLNSPIKEVTKPYLKK